MRLVGVKLKGLRVRHGVGTPLEPIVVADEGDLSVAPTSFTDEGSILDGDLEIIDEGTL